MPEKPPSELMRYVVIGALVGVVVVAGYFLFFTGPSSVGVVTVSSPLPVTSAPSGSTSPVLSSRPKSQTSSTASSAPATAPITQSPQAEIVDPAKALAEAIREPDLDQRRIRIMRILRQWASTDPDAAAQAAMAWPGGDRVEPIAAVLAGVAGRPDDALRLGTYFCREDPAWAPEHGSALIDALAQAGNFSQAVSFALVGGAEVEGETRNKWLITAFSGWAQREPQLAALAATSDLPQQNLQEEALIAVVARWRRLNPDGPEKFLAQLPAGRERTALANALRATSGAGR